MNFFFRFLKKAFQKELGFAIALPAVLWQWLFLLIPATVLFLQSFREKDILAFTLKHYKTCIKAHYFGAIFNSLILAYTTAILCLAFCMPIVLFIHFRISKKFRSIVLFFLMMPSWTNFILRIYSCFFLLRNEGFIFKLLKTLGLFHGYSLITNSVVTYLVMVYCYFPFMLLPLYSAVGSINPKVLEASADLGASDWQTFWRVIVPVSLRGTFFSFTMVVLSAFGEFSIPEIIGGAKHVYWGNLVVSKILFLSDYYAGSAVMFWGIFCLLFSIIVFYFLLWCLLRFFSLFLFIPDKVLNFKITQ